MTTESNSGDLIARLEASNGLKADTALMSAAAARIKELHWWKAQATQLLNEWDKVWEAAGCPGPLGESKAANTLRALNEPIGPDPKVGEG